MDLLQKSWQLQSLLGVYTVVPKRDSTGALLEDQPAAGNTDILYLARGKIFNVNFDVNKMEN